MSQGGPLPCLTRFQHGHLGVVCSGYMDTHWYAPNGRNYSISVGRCVMNDSLDKRVDYIRIDNRIIDAFVHLLKDKSLEQITVKDIVTEAKIGRGTFYLH